MTLRFDRIAAFVGTGLLLAACSATNEDTTAETNGNFGSGASDGDGTGGSSSGGDGPILSGGTTSGGSGGGSGGGESNGECAGTDYDAELIPLDMFIMLDRSGSMAGGNWNSVTSAISSFVNTPVQGYIGVGLGFFPVDGAGTCFSDPECGSYGPCNIVFPGFPGTCANAPDECSVASYSNPAVPIQPLPGAAAPINAAMSGTGPGGGTPMTAALQGALAYAQINQSARPTHITTVVLVSDGFPEGCGSNSVSTVSNAAAQGLTQGFRTFVIGIGDFLADLEQIATAGGTAPALIIGSGNISDAFLAKLEEIRGSVQCQFQIPLPTDGSTPNYDKVNVEFTPEGGTKESIPRVNSEADCGSQPGYYYDDPINPTTIILCPDSCTNIEANPGKLRVTLGCDSIIR